MEEKQPKTEGIQQNTPPQAGAMPQPLPPKKNNRTVLIIGIIIAVLLVGGGITAFALLNPFQDTPKQTEKTEKRSDTKRSDDTAKKSDSPSKVAAICVSRDDMAAGFSNYPDTSLSDFDSLDFLVSEYVFFLPDSTDYEFPDQVGGVFDTFAQFYEKHNNKQFVYELSGSTYESSASDAGAALATQRVEKIKQELVSRGVSAGKITVGESRFADSHEALRNVEVTLLKSGSCVASS